MTGAEKGRRLWKPARPRSRASLVGLSSAAILSVYAAGYFRTAGSEPVVAAEIVQDVRTTATTEAVGSSAPTTRTGATQGSTAPRAQATPTTATAGSTTAAYMDGSYTGLGSSRHGSIGVTVVVAGGKITSAEITTCQTKYPCSKVSSLPGQVLARQSSSVNYISGATDSSRAYAGAVAQALAKAKA